MERLFGCGLILWIVALVAATIELAAQQPPDSGVHLGIPAGPLALLKQQCAFFGVVLMLAQLRGHHRVRRLATLLLVGVGVCVLAQAGAAMHGFYAVSPSDFRPEARIVFWLRSAGYGILAACLLWFIKLEWRRRHAHG